MPQDFGTCKNDSYEVIKVEKHVYFYLILTFISKCRLVFMIRRENCSCISKVKYDDIAHKHVKKALLTLELTNAVFIIDASVSLGHGKKNREQSLSHISNSCCL